ncbi:MAG TPA: membrane-associated protein [Gammaproteobacteria bacterium]
MRTTGRSSSFRGRIEPRAAVAALVGCAAVAALAAHGQTFADPPPAEQTDAVTWGLRALFTALVALIVPVYLVKYGPSNFLWFSDIGLLGVWAALWLESPLLGSMMALAMLIPETVWIVSFVTGALSRGRGVGTLASYMFDRSLPLYLRCLSLFHLALPPGAVWLVYRYGYDERALLAQTLLAWIVLPLTLWLAPPEKNVNWVRGFGHPPRRRLSQPAHFALMMLLYPLLIYLPTHLLLVRVAG